MGLSGSNRRGGRLAFVLGLSWTVIALPHAASAQTSEAVDRSALRVCADPSNLPFSNQAGEGYENKIAELLAAELGVPVRYTWFPQVMGFVRNTLRARKCDLVMGVPLGFELLQNTNPYYRTTYSLVYRADSGLEITALDDPALKPLRLGLIAGTPPATLFAKYGLLGNTRSYQLMADTRYHNPSKKMVDDVAAGEIDVGALWGPIAGYHAKQHNPPIKVVPLASQPGLVRLDFRITMGLRFNEPEWKHRLNGLIEKLQPEINAILRDFGVPLLNDQGQAITGPSK